MEQIKAMLEKIAKDSDFAEEMKALMEEGNVGAIIKAAGEKGFTFTEADWQAYLEWSRNMGGKDCQSKELSPEELADVAGGANPSGECWFHAASDREYREGAWRKRCNQFACKAWSIANGVARFYTCRCHGLHKCVNNWHYEAGCQ